MDHQYRAALLAAVKTDEDEWELRVRQVAGTWHMD